MRVHPCCSPLYLNDPLLAVCCVSIRCFAVIILRTLLRSLSISFPCHFRPFRRPSSSQIQAALPTGARLRARGRFDAGMLQPWITFVQDATTALELMEAWLLLETSINPRWLETTHTRYAPYYFSEFFGCYVCALVDGVG